MSEELRSITDAMITLEQEISEEQNYINKHGKSNDEMEYDKAWEEYKKNANYNLRKWDEMKKKRDGIKTKVKSNQKNHVYDSKMNSKT